MARVAVALAALGLVASACNSQLLRPPAPVLADGGGALAAGFTEEVTFREPTVLHSFFPEVLPVHPSDAVNFDLEDTGEPHTVALGSLVDDALGAVAALGPGASRHDVEALPEMAQLPMALPTPAGDQPPAIPSATEPCFVDEGPPPGDGTCSSEQPEFDGSHSFYSSGVLTDRESFQVQLSADATPGRYRFMCLVHRTAMTGTLEIRAPNVDRPRVADVKERASEEQVRATSVIEQPFQEALRAPQGQVLAGIGPPGRSAGFVAYFHPEEVAVDAGQPLTWRIYQGHAIAFEPSRQALEGLFIRQDDRWTINLDAWRAEGSLEPPPEARSALPVAEEVNVDGGTYDGQGAWSSGFLRGVPPSAVTYTMRFSEPGRYAYRCLVHPEMRGEVVVR
jgi:plastocyanin